MQEYLVPAGYGEAAFTEKRSRFTGRVWLVETEEAALACIKEMREKYWEATHNVYAYILKEAHLTRYSDDGEPQGTAGLPTLNVFQGEKIYNVCCVVTRYYGGILLGAGGLVRAYSKAAKMALDAAGISCMRQWVTLVIPAPYHFLERIKKEATLHEGFVDQVEYGQEVVITTLIPLEKAENFQNRLRDISAATLKIQSKGHLYRQIPIK